MTVDIIFLNMNDRISRKTASKLLKVSIRTVDRYIASGKLKTKKIDGRVWLSKKDIKHILRKNSGHDNILSTGNMSVDSVVSSVVDMSSGGVDSVSTGGGGFALNKTQTKESGVYKKLYQELKQELEVKQSRLEGANYRVGQLEAMVKESVPLLQYQKQLSVEKTARLELEEENESLLEKIEIIKKKLKEETVSKKVFFSLLFIIILLQPLWLLFIFKS